MANNYPYVASLSEHPTPISHPPQHGGFLGRPPATSPLTAPPPTSALQTRFLNSSGYDSNAQIPISNFLPPNIPPPPHPHALPPDFLRHLANTTLPLPPPHPPSLPPVPIPHVGFSAAPPPPIPSHAFDNVASVQLNNTSNSFLPTPINIHSTDAAEPHSGQVVLDGREEGELSDGELEEERGSEIVQKDPAEPPMSQGVDTTMGNLFSVQGGQNAEAFSSEGEDSGSSYDPPSVATPPPAQPTTATFLQRTDTVSHQDATQAGGYASATYPPLLNHSADLVQMRERAKGALLSLAPHGIRYSEVVREGVDPQLLLQLYRELGIRDWDHALAQRQPSPLKKLGAFQNTVNALGTGTESATLVSPPTHEKPSSSMSVQQMPHLVPNSISEPTSETAVEPPKPVNNSNRSVGPTIVSTNVAQTTGAKGTTPDVATERKDRIAQLLAARTGKSLPGRTEQAASTVFPQPSFQTNGPATGSAEHLSVPNHSPSVQDDPTLTKLAKSKAQTELVRQRMESLRKEAIAKSQIRNQLATDVGQQIHSPIDRISTELDQHQSNRHSFSANAPQNAGSGKAVTETYSGNASLETVAENNFALRIPGLFMTSRESSVLRSGDSGMNAVSTNGSFRITSEPNDVQDKSEQATPSSQDYFSGELVTNLTSQRFTTRVPQKRPLASDSFDEQTPPSKRISDRPDYADYREASPNDLESDDGSRGEEMEIDQESEEEGEIDQAEVPVPADPQPFSKSQPPPQRAVLSSSLSPAPQKQVSITSIPTKETDKEALWRIKNKEIEMMRKKIAEMEQRKQAKREQSQIFSPRPSRQDTPSQAATPSKLPPDERQLKDASNRNLSDSPRSPQKFDTTQLQKIANDNVTPRGADMTLLTSVKRVEHNPVEQTMPLERQQEEVSAKRNTEAQQKQARLAVTLARLAQVKQEAEIHAAEIREARKREAELFEEAAKLEAQLENGSHSSDIDSRVIPSDHLETTSAAVDLKEHLPSSSAQATEMVPNLLGDLSTESPTTVANSQYSHSPPKEVDSDFLNPEMAINEHVINNDPRAENDVDSGILASAAPAIPKDRPDPVVSRSSLLTSPASTPTPAHISHHSPYLEPSFDVDSSVQVAQEGQIMTPTENAESDEQNESVSMSDNASEDYEPADVIDPILPPETHSDEYEPDDVSRVEVGSQAVLNDVEDDYEPAENLEPLEPPKLPGIEPDSSNLEVLKDAEVEAYSPTSASQNNTTEIPVTGLENTTKLSSSSDHLDTQHREVVTGDDVVRSEVSYNASTESHFTPYDSLLSTSRNFRYDPHFLERGLSYRSLTYSHKIDPQRVVCINEVNGQQCRDPECTDQHFEQLQLPDDQILVQMSSANDFKQKEERDQFVTGLKRVIAQLRANGVKEFDQVANELAAYRRRFREQLDPELAQVS